MAVRAGASSPAAVCEACPAGKYVLADGSFCEDAPTVIEHPTCRKARAADGRWRRGGSGRGWGWGKQGYSGGSTRPEPERTAPANARLKPRPPLPRPSRGATLQGPPRPLAGTGRGWGGWVGGGVQGGHPATRSGAVGRAVSRRCFAVPDREFRLAVSARGARAGGRGRCRGGVAGPGGRRGRRCGRRPLHVLPSWDLLEGDRCGP